MTTLTIGSTVYTVYQDPTAVTAYAQAAVGDGATAWAIADPNTHKQLCVSATRLLDRQAWQGDKTDPDQDLAFPRTGLTYPNGTAVDSTTVPQEVLDAHSELCMSLAAGATVQDQLVGANSTKRLKAGSAEIEYFRGLASDATRFPLAVMELIGFWLGGAPAAISESGGTDDCSHFKSQFGVRRSL